MKTLTNNWMLQNKQAKNMKQEGKKMREVENTRTTRFAKIHETDMEIHEVATGKNPLSWNQGAPHVKLVQKNLELLIRKLMKSVEHTYNNKEVGAFHEITSHFYKAKLPKEWVYR